MSDNASAAAVIVNPESVTPEQTPDSAVPSQKTPDMASRFAALSRKEKEVREAGSRAAELEGKYKEFSDLEANAKENPLAILSKYGLDLDTVIAASLGTEEDTPKTVEEQIQALRDEITNEKTAAKEKVKTDKETEDKALQANIDEAILKHQNSIVDYLSQNPEKYELINLQEANELVWEVTEAWYEANNGEVLTPEEAADKVEKHLEDQIRKAMKLSRFTPTSNEFEWESNKTEPKSEKAPVSKTLTNEYTAPAGSKTVYLNDEESKSAAAALLKWD